jgi:ornithine--oxo-acid transaminase
LFGYDKFVGLTSGGEAVDAAIKIARKWAFFVKGIRDGSSHILTTTACYHGVTMSTVSLASKKAERRWHAEPAPALRTTSAAC